MTPTIRKYPRTMQEAFGPYTDHVLHEPERVAMPVEDAIVLGACAAAFVVFLVMVFLGWVK